MKMTARSGVGAMIAGGCLLLAVFLGVEALPADESEGASKADIPATLEEARGRARLLHETIHGTLQVVHRDFFDPEDLDKIPSSTLEDVFAELADSWGIELHWLGVEGETQDVDHEPQDDFEKKAVEALKGGAEEYEAVEGDRYRHTGVIVLHNACLKCHVPNRRTLEDRVAGLTISMRFGKK